MFTRAVALLVILVAAVQPAAAALPAPAHDRPVSFRDVSTAPGAPPTITIVDPIASTLTGEGNDWATVRWGDPWDMDRKTDLYLIGSAVCGSPYPIYHASVANGVWTGQVLTTPAEAWLLSPGFATGSLNLDREGLSRPIDAGRYYRLTFRMKTNSMPGGLGQGRLRYGDGSWENQTDPNHWSWSKQFQVFTDNQWHVYSLDLRAITPGTGNLAWTSGKWITALGIDPGVGPGSTVQFDWFRLSDDSVTQRVAWTGSWRPQATVELGLGNPADGFVPVHVYDPGVWNGVYLEPATISANSGSYILRGGLQNGTYNVAARVTDNQGTGTSSPAGSYVVTPAVWGTFTRPSYTAGVDWRAQLPPPYNNPWDMDTVNRNDFISWEQSSTPEYVMLNGADVMHAITSYVGNLCTVQGDSSYQLRFNQQAIPRTRFHWLSMRLWVEGTPDLGFGSVARVSWWNTTFTQCGETNDIILQEGWNTYSVDLSRADVIEPQSGCRLPWTNQDWMHLRIDPHEVPEATSWWLDYISITDDIVANASVTVQWTESPANGKPTQATLYWDNDRDPANGKQVIVTGRGTPGMRPDPRALQAPACTGNCVYLPLVNNSSLGTLCSNGQCSYTWSTGALPDGNYYLYVETSDGYSTVGRYSDTPVEVRH